MAVRLSTSDTGIGETVPASIFTCSDGSIMTTWNTSLAQVFYRSTNGGSSWSPYYRITNSGALPGGLNLNTCEVALDSNDVLHLAAQCTSSGGGVFYATMSATSGSASFSGWETVASGFSGTASFFPLDYRCNIALDSNGKPHIVYSKLESSMGSNYSHIFYQNKVSGSWSTAEAVSTGTTISYNPGKTVVGPSNNVYTTYYSSSNCYSRVRTTSWQTESTVVSAKIPNTMLVDSNGNTYIYSYSTSTGDIYENSTDTTFNTIVSTSAFYFLGACFVGTDRYLFYIDSGYDVYWTKNSGSGWTTPVKLYDSGSYYYRTVATEWQYYFENQTNQINYLFNGSAIDNSHYPWFDYLSLSSGPTTYNESLSLKRSIAVTPISKLTAKNSIALGRSLGVSAAGGTTYSNSIALSRSLSTSARAYASVGLSITLSRSLSVSSSSGWRTYASVPLGRSLVTGLISRSSGQSLISLARTLDIPPPLTPITLSAGLILSQQYILGVLEDVSAEPSIIEESIALERIQSVALDSVCFSQDTLTLEWWNGIALQDALLETIEHGAWVTQAGVTYLNSNPFDIPENGMLIIAVTSTMEGTGDPGQPVMTGEGMYFTHLSHALLQQTPACRLDIFKASGSPGDPVVTATYPDPRTSIAMAILSFTGYDPAEPVYGTITSGSSNIGDGPQDLTLTVEPDPDDVTLIITAVESSLNPSLPVLPEGYTGVYDIATTGTGAAGLMVALRPNSADPTVTVQDVYTNSGTLDKAGMAALAVKAKNHKYKVDTFAIRFPKLGIQATIVIGASLSLSRSVGIQVAAQNIVEEHLSLNRSLFADNATQSQAEDRAALSRSLSLSTESVTVNQIEESISLGIKLSVTKIKSVPKEESITLGRSQSVSVSPISIAVDHIDLEQFEQVALSSQSTGTDIIDLDRNLDIAVLEERAQKTYDETISLSRSLSLDHCTQTTCDDRIDLENTASITLIFLTEATDQIALTTGLDFSNQSISLSDDSLALERAIDLSSANNQVVNGALPLTTSLAVSNETQIVAENEINLDAILDSILDASFDLFDFIDVKLDLGLTLSEQRNIRTIEESISLDRSHDLALSSQIQGNDQISLTCNPGLILDTQLVAGDTLDLILDHSLSLTSQIGTVEETVIFQNEQGLELSNQLNAFGLVSIVKTQTIEPITQSNLGDGLEFSRVLDAHVRGEIEGAIEEEISLRRSLYVDPVSQWNTQAEIDLAENLAVQNQSQLATQTDVSLEKSLGSELSAQSQVQEQVDLAHAVSLSEETQLIAQDILALEHVLALLPSVRVPIEESITLRIALSVTKIVARPKEDGTQLSGEYNLSMDAQVVHSESLILSEAHSLDSGASQASTDTLELSRSHTVAIALNLQAANALSLAQLLTTTHATQINGGNSVVFTRINVLSPLSTIQIEHDFILKKAQAIYILDERGVHYYEERLAFARIQSLDLFHQQIASDRLILAQYERTLSLAQIIAQNETALAVQLALASRGLKPNEESWHAIHVFDLVILRKVSFDVER